MSVHPVCIVAIADEFPDKEISQKIAAEMNLSKLKDKFMDILAHSD